MDCETARTIFSDPLRKSLPPRVSSQLEKHLAACAQCAKNKSQFTAMWALIEPTSVTTPDALSENTLKHIQRLIQKESKGLNLWRLLTAFGCGLVLALFCIGSLNHQIDLKGFSVATIASCMAWWAGLFVLSCAVALGRYRFGKVRLGFITSTAVMSVGLIMLGTYFYPKLDLLKAWLSSGMGNSLALVLGSGMSHLAFGFLLALIPTFLAALYFGRQIHKSWFLHGFGAAVGFLLLLLPNMYIQCCFVPFTLASLLVFGMALGGFSGTLGALGLYQKFPQAI